MELYKHNHDHVQKYGIYKITNQLNRSPETSRCSE